MGWVSFLEDTLEKIQENIQLAKAALRNPDEFADVHRRESLKALNDAQAILVQAWNHLELATAPEMNLAHENEQLKATIGKLEHQLRISQGNAEKASHEAANHLAELRDKKLELADLKKRYRKLDKDFAKIPFASAVDAFCSPGMMKKHKPDG